MPEPELKPLVLKDSEWQRGEKYSGETYLLDPNNGKRCCLGILARDLGIPDSVISDVHYPSGIRDLWPIEICDYEAMFTEPNDSKNTSDLEKLEILTPLFAELGYQIDFRPTE